jgi:hypothetical protein
MMRAKATTVFTYTMRTAVGRSAHRTAIAALKRGLATPSGNGLSFQLTEDQRAFQLAARTFAKDVIIPQAAELDRTMKFPHDVFNKAWEMGTSCCCKRVNAVEI